MTISAQRQPDGSEMTSSAPADAPMLEVQGVRAAYGQIEVVHGVDLTLPAGGILAVLGPNGAGKSTLLRCITGTHPVTEGEIRLAGRRVNGANPVELARRGVCLVPEGRGIFPNLTVRENLQMVTYSGVSRSNAVILLGTPGILTNIAKRDEEPAADAKPENDGLSSQLEWIGLDSRVSADDLRIIDQRLALDSVAGAVATTSAGSAHAAS